MVATHNLLLFPQSFSLTEGLVHPLRLPCIIPNGEVKASEEVARAAYKLWAHAAWTPCAALPNLWDRYLTTLFLSFLACKMGIKIVATS